MSNPRKLTAHANPTPTADPRLISVIICSIDESKGRRISAHYEALLSGRNHELILIGDARSVCEGYNRGFAQSSGGIVIFSHDDIEIVSDDFAARLLRHLSVFDLVGVAGTSLLVGPDWILAGQPFIHGCVVHRLETALQFECFGPPTVRAQALDGLFFAARREVCEAVPFDAATFDGFHHYDLDFSYRASSAGFKIAVLWDLLIIHNSTGTFDSQWRLYADRFVAKHRRSLPPWRPHQPSWKSTQFAQLDEIIALQREMITEAHPRADVGDGH